MEDNELVTSWWAQWWSVDRSWETLKARDAHIPLATAADGRRIRDDQELISIGELVREPGTGRHWHILHMPLAWRDGSPAKSAFSKEQSDLLDSIVVERMRASSASHGAVAKLGDRFAWRSWQADMRAAFTGAVLPRGIPLVPASYDGKINVVCDDAYLGERLQLSGARFGPGCDFRNSLFLRGGVFFGVQFADHCNFDNARFLGETSFEGIQVEGGASFWDVDFDAPVDFSSAIFNGTVGIRGARFREKASFYQVRFTNKTWFSPTHDEGNATQFDREADFERAYFGDAVSFEGVLFKGSASFSGGRFKGDADFLDCEFPDVAQGFLDGFQGAVFFEQVRFGAGTQHPRTEAYLIVPALADARFEGTVIFPHPLNELDEYILQDGMIERLAAHASSQNLLVHAEKGAIRLKDAMEWTSDRGRQQLFYRLELIARYARGSRLPTEGMAALLYAEISRHGADIGRPLRWLFYLIAGATAFYWVLNASVSGSLFMRLDIGAGRPIDPEIFDALLLAVTRVAPFGPWADLENNPWAAHFIGGHGALWAAAMHLLIALQTLCAVGLAFLSGLAVRRRFQLD